jgi:hypothetical protein
MMIVVCIITTEINVLRVRRLLLLSHVLLLLLNLSSLIQIAIELVKHGGGCGLSDFRHMLNPRLQGPREKLRELMLLRIHFI